METPYDPTPLDMDPIVDHDTAYAKADLVKRFLALLIDGIIGGILYAILAAINMGLGWFAYAAYILIRDGLELDFMDGRSIGKKLMKLRPVRLDGGTMDIQASVMRNWPMALGSLVNGALFLFGGWTLYTSLSWLATLAGLIALVECILVITDKDGRRIGDKQAHTQVIQTDE